MRVFGIFIGILLIIFGMSALLIQYVPSVCSVVNTFKFPFSFENYVKEHQNIKIVSEESVVIDVVKQVGPSVVTIAAVSSQAAVDQELFEFFGIPQPQTDESDEIELQNIGSGFILSEDGLIVTNKHVVSDPQATYSIITSDEVTFQITQIYRDPLNDIAIIKIDPSEHAQTPLPSVSLGDSDNLQVGQLAIAIGTPLGEFNNSVTKGIVSGLGRGIVAGSPLEGFVERLDNVIQTDAAISPGNSGGPLLNARGEVIGVNTAVSQDGENIGFALPINLVKDVIRTFEDTGRFDRAYLGVTYHILARELALQNEVPEGAIVQSVLTGSPAEHADIQVGDIITHIDSTRITERGDDLATVISQKHVGDEVTISFWRDTGDGETLDVRLILGNATEQLK